MLSVTVDPRLSMCDAACSLSCEAGWRTRSILRTRRFHDTRSLIRLFKAQILSYLEGATPALYHAAPSVLAPIDEVQIKFLEELGVSSSAALLEHNLAPLPMLRDIAMLGVLYKVSRGTCPKPIQDLFSLRVSSLDSLGFSCRRRHGWQIADPVGPSHPTFIRRSIYGLIKVFNGLPAETVGADTLKSFQSKLQSGAKAAARQSVRDWQAMFHPCR